jgi:hypothetical protein
LAGVRICAWLKQVEKSKRERRIRVFIEKSRSKVNQGLLN